MTPLARPPVWLRPIPIATLIRHGRERPMVLVLALGVGLRLLEYAYNRIPWLDEGSLVACIREVDRVGLFGALGSNQLAPPGFLACEWLAGKLLGTSSLALRFVPLLAGLVGLFLFQLLASRVLTRRGAFLAVLLFVLTDDLIYYCAEIKQYSTDLALSLLMLVRGLRVEDHQDQGSRRSGLVRLGALGAGLVWFSHPLAFTLAAIGIVGFTRAIGRRDRRAGLTWLGIGLVWVACILAVRAVGMRQLDYRSDMWSFWQFAFPPWPIASVSDATWPLRRVLFLFVSPLNCDGPFGPRWSVALPVFLALLGTIRLGRQRPTLRALLLLPGVLALGASYLRFYPFHGRLLLFWVPILLIMVAAGLDAVTNRWLRWFLIGWVVSGPARTSAESLFGPRERFDLNPVGDRRPAHLDPIWFPWPPPERPIRSHTR